MTAEWRPQGRSFCFSSANVCLLPDSLARFNNLSDTHRRAREVGKRIRNGASRPQIKIYIDSPTNTSIRYSKRCSLCSIFVPMMNYSLQLIICVTFWLLIFFYPFLVRPPSAVLPQVSVVPPLWTSVQIKHTPPMALLTMTRKHPQSARFTPRVPVTVPLTPPQRFLAPQNALFTRSKRTHRQTVHFTLLRTTAALNVLSTPQETRRTAQCIQLGLTMAIMTVQYTEKGPRQNHPPTAHCTHQGSKSVSVPQNQSPRRRMPTQGTVTLGTEGETMAA